MSAELGPTEREYLNESISSASNGNTDVIAFAVLTLSSSELIPRYQILGARRI